MTLLDPAFATVCIAVLVQVCGVLFWAGTVSHRLKRLEADVSPVSSLSEAMGLLEERIGELLDRLGERPLTGRGRRRTGGEGGGA